MADDLTNPEPSSPPFPIPTTESSSPAAPAASEPAAPETPPPPPSPPPPAPPPPEITEPLFKRLSPLIIGLVVLVGIYFLVTKIVLPRLQTPKAPESITLKYWGLWEPENIITQIISDYQQDHPNVTIQYLRQSPQDYRERLQSALARGDGPDIFRWHNTWLPMLKADLAPLPESIMSPSSFNSTFYPVAKQDVFSNGQYYGIPLMFDSLALYINQDIFSSVPDLSPPTTWDNLRQTAFQLTQRDERGQITQAGVALGSVTNVDNFSDILGLMILQNGGNPGKPDTEAVRSALKFYTLFLTEDHSWSEALPQSTYAFATGKVAMILAPSWRVHDIKQINPQLNFKLYPVPQLPDTTITWATYWIEGVSQKSLHQEAAWEFLNYLSSKAVLLKMFDLTAQTRLFGEPYSRMEMAEALKDDPYIGAIFSQAPMARSWPLASDTYDNGLNDRLIKYYQDAVNGLINRTSEIQVFAALSQGVNQILSQYGLNQ
jgi:multiple sugar transport system substrate-binding protein